MPYLYHSFTSQVSDSTNSALVRPSVWNARFQYGNAAGTGPSGTDATIRELLTANRTYYVRTDGSNSNDGLTNSAGGAFLTFSQAFAQLGKIDGQDVYTVTIQGNNATHTGPAYFWEAPVGMAAGITLDCAGGTIAGDGTDSALSIGINFSGYFTIQNVTLTNSGSTHALLEVGAAGTILIGSGVVFGTGSTAHIYLRSPGASVSAPSGYTITGGAQWHILTYNTAGSVLNINGATITLTGTPAFSVAFADIRYGCALLIGGCTFIGSATGPRYGVSLNGVIDTSGGGATYLPGDSAGSTATGGQYV